MQWSYENNLEETGFLSILPCEKTVFVVVIRSFSLKIIDLLGEITIWKHIKISFKTAGVLEDLVHQFLLGKCGKGSFVLGLHFGLCQFSVIKSSPWASGRLTTFKVWEIERKNREYNARVHSYFDLSQSW